MDNMMILLGLVFVFALIAPIFMILVTYRADANISKRIKIHNKGVLLRYNQSSDLDEMWLRAKEFLKSTNGGEHPCDFVDEIRFIDYKDIYNQKDIQERKGI